MNESERAEKVAILRDAAERLRALADDITDAEIKGIAAEMLDRRAARIAAGAPDYSAVDLDLDLRLAAGEPADHRE